MVANQLHNFTMASTPPPPSRIRTPPTPRHGPMLDNYEPYSPRRSSRLQQQKDLNLPNTPSRAPALSSTPAEFISSTPRKTKAIKRQLSSQTLSPPTSPESISARQEATANTTVSTGGSGQATRTERGDNSFASHEGAPEAAELTSMLPTPRKTPSKHRVVTHGTTTIIDFRAHLQSEILPTPRRHRIRNTLHNTQPLFTAVQVHTDSRDRRPDMEGAEDNPFVGPRKKINRTRRCAPQSREEIEMDARTRRGEGLIYSFRGRKMFRPYTDVQGGGEAQASLHNNWDSQTARLARFAGTCADRPLTRSSLEPRLLFPGDDERQSDSADEDVLSLEEEAAISAPPTADKPAQTTVKDALLASDKPVVSAGGAKDNNTPPIDLPASQQRPKKKTSPFDHWPRRKSGTVSSSTASSSSSTQYVTPSKGVKRVAASDGADERGVASKRTRSPAMAR